MTILRTLNPLWTLAKVKAILYTIEESVKDSILAETNSERLIIFHVTSIIMDNDLIT